MTKCLEITNFYLKVYLRIWDQKCAGQNDKNLDFLLSQLNLRLGIFTLSSKFEIFGNFDPNILDPTFET